MSDYYEMKIGDLNDEIAEKDREINCIKKESKKALSDLGNAESFIDSVGELRDYLKYKDWLMLTEGEE